MTSPNIKENDTKNWKMIFNDEFNGTELDRTKWRNETLMPDFQGNKAQASQHWTNNKGIDRDGKVGGSRSMGKRHALWYDDHLDVTLGVSNGILEMGALMSDERDPTIHDSHHPYTNPRDGLIADLRKKIYTCWIDTYAMSWHDGAVRPAREGSPNFFFRYGFVEVGVNFENMKTKGLRCSAWLLPAVDPADPDVSLVGTTYNAEAEDGLECDIFEYERSPGAEHLLLCKNIGANAKNIPPVDCRKFGIDITKGDHTIAVHWSDKATIWYVDGIEVARDEDAIVDIAMAVYLTREGNTAAGSRDGVKPDAPYIQKDTGLYGYNIGTEDKETIDSDKAHILYMRVFQDNDQKDNWIAPGWVDGSGIDDSTAETIVRVATPSAKPIPEEVSDFDLKIVNGRLTWNDVNVDSKYDIKFNANKYLTSVKGTSFKLPGNYQEGVYYVTSTPEGGPFVDSNKVEFVREDVIAEVKNTTFADMSKDELLDDIELMLAEVRKK